MKRLFLTLLCAAFTAASAALPALPQPATSFGATVQGGWLYVYGGNTGKAHEFHRDCVKGDFFRLQLHGGTEWEALPGGPGLLSPALVTYQGRIIRIGGMTARNAKGEKNDLHSTDVVSAYDPATKSWTALPSLPQPRSSHDAVIFEDVLYVGGGWILDGPGEGDWQSTMLTLNLRDPTAAWHEVAAPFQRRAIAAAVHEGRVWFIGGMDQDNKPSRVVDWFEPAKGVWGKGPELPEGVMRGFGVAACTLKERLFISPLSGKVSALRADGAAWETVTSLEKPRFFHRLFPFDAEQLVAVGGSNRDRQITDLELVSIASKELAVPPER